MLNIGVNVNRSEQISKGKHNFIMQTNRVSPNLAADHMIAEGINTFNNSVAATLEVFFRVNNNLKWIEAPLKPAIIRMRVFLQSFHFDVRHISGPTELNKLVYNGRKGHWVVYRIKSSSSTSGACTTYTTTKRLDVFNNETITIHHSQSFCLLIY